MEIFWRPKKLKKVPVRHGDPMENHEQCSHPWIRAGDISLQPKPFTNLIHILSDRIQHFRNNTKAIFKAAFTYRQNYHGVFRVLSDVLCKLPFSILPKAAWPQWPARLMHHHHLWHHLQTSEYWKVRISTTHRQIHELDSATKGNIRNRAKSKHWFSAKYCRFFAKYLPFHTKTDFCTNIRRIVGSLNPRENFSSLY